MILHAPRPHRFPATRRLLWASLLLVAPGLWHPTAAGAAPLTAHVVVAATASPEIFQPGTSVRPDGATLTVDRSSLRLDGQPWMPVMGEFHYSRYPADEWRTELLKMKAGGIDIVSTYVFWIYQQETEGPFDWSGQRDLRRFVQLCADVGLKVIVRCGPWSHGEVRNGGLPDWIVQRFGKRVRTTDPAFLQAVRGLYGQIAAQLDGLRWKQGGPVIGIQLDNEYRGPADYLLALKKIAINAGLDVPLYTRTGWPALTTPMPFGELLPLYGSYAEGFWDRELTSMPGHYRDAFRFSRLRLDSDIANEQLGRRVAQDAADTERYPFLTCEMGGGMATSYHRRILMEPADVEATALVKLGDGSSLLGYYMYHGGTNPDGRLTTLMEAQDTPMTNWNDLPVKNYDFQAPLGDAGQLRPQYHVLRRLHLFLHDFGPALAAMPATMPDVRPAGPDDGTTLRWTVRSNGRAGYVFVNNHERSTTLPAKTGVQFSITLADRKPLIFPATPVTVPTDAQFVWPFNLDLGHGVRLAWATAQPVGTVDDGPLRTVFFAATPGVAAEFAVAGETAVRTATPGRGPAWRIDGPAGSVQVVLLDEADSLALWKGTWHGRERVFLARAGLVLDHDQVGLSSPDASDLTLAVYPAPPVPTAAAIDGVFTRLSVRPLQPAVAPAPVILTSLRAAGPARAVPFGRIDQPVAAAPTDADFAQAAVWRIKLPANLDLGTDPLLRIRYVGDVARLMLNGRLLDDNFYNGRGWEIGLRRHAPAIQNGELLLEILPLRPDAPIFLAASARPDFHGAASLGAVQSVEIVPRFQAQVEP